MENVCVQFEGVSKRYVRHVAVRDLTFTLPKGKIIGLIGPNGSGKSTILKLMSGLIQPSAGTVTIDGQPVGRRISSIVSYASDQDNLYSFYTVSEMVQFYANMFPDFDRDRAQNLISFMELDGNMRIRALSKGNMGRLKISLALSRRAPLILMDEPLSGLDPMVRRSIIKGLISFIDLEEQTVIMSTHEVTEVEPLLDAVVLIHNGRVIAVRDVEEIQTVHNTGLVGWMADSLVTPGSR